MRGRLTPTNDQVTIDAQTHRAIEMVIDRLPAQFDVRDFILFGSRARRDHRPDSDADVAVVFHRLPDRYGAVLQLAAVAYDVMLATGVLVQAVPISADEYDDPEQATNPAFIRAIHAEGLRL